ncbi:uncharacterized protein PG986_006393 [Apiospora aurea]|uniref:Uncharacterized protein n=1 Tax=Apiospora aurea TaxID=335848 RepID=A0ABR1QKA0_9PEZI
MVTQLINLRPSFTSEAETNPDSVRELLDIWEKTYLWHELCNFIGFDLKDEHDELLDQVRSRLSQTLSQGLDVDLGAERLLSKVVESTSRFAFWSTLLGGCLVETYGRGDFDDEDHGISGVRIVDMARIIERHHDLENTPSKESFMPWPGRCSGGSTGYSLKPLHSPELDGVPQKILDKLAAQVRELDVNTLDFLRGWPLHRKTPPASPRLRNESDSESPSDASFDPSEETSDSEDLATDTEEAPGV